MIDDNLCWNSIHDVDDCAIVANNSESYWKAEGQRMAICGIVIIHSRTVNGMPFSLRMLVKYKVPEPVAQEICQVTNSLYYR